VNVEQSRWKGAVALVTGASSGIGRAVAKDLHSAGCKLAVCARRIERLDALKDELQGTHADFQGFQVDLRDTSSILAMFSKIRSQWGGVDILINSAGTGHMTSLIDGAEDDWRDIFDVNVLALSVCTREAVQDMLRRQTPGHIIHISSMSAHRVPKGAGMYAASKYAVRALTEGLRLELQEHHADIRISSVSPGTVETEFAERVTKSKDLATQIYSRFKTLQAEDIASTVHFILHAPQHMQLHDVLIRPTKQPS
tara:strand:- start:1106 stop:1867 length:762 start_codon:yes stop_codon:yes gene_type:complete